jgi:alpha-amylase
VIIALAIVDMHHFASTRFLM